VHACRQGEVQFPIAWIQISDVEIIMEGVLD